MLTQRSGGSRLRTRIDTQVYAIPSVGPSVIFAPHAHPNSFAWSPSIERVDTRQGMWIRRVGSTVFRKWGAVEVHGWEMDERSTGRSTARESNSCGAAQPAKDYVRNAIARRRSPAITRWLEIRDPAPTCQSWRRTRTIASTILIVDIVRSTEKVARSAIRVGTSENHYDAAVRRELKLCAQGSRHDGGRLLATFDAPAAASAAQRNPRAVRTRLNQGRATRGRIQGERA